jgi:hypothetical protein
METPAIWASLWRNQKAQTMDYVLPAGVVGAAASLRLPNAYTRTVSAANILCHEPRMKSRGIDHSKLLEPPPLSVTLEFSDIAGERHTAVFDLKIVLYSSQEGQFDGFVEPKRQ